jgi:O-antigen/teichoic acid export membrane protein
MLKSFVIFFLAFTLLMNISPDPAVFATYNPVAQLVFLVAACGLLVMMVACGILAVFEGVATAKEKK